MIKDGVLTIKNQTGDQNDPEKVLVNVEDTLIFKIITTSGMFLANDKDRVKNSQIFIYFQNSSAYTVTTHLKRVDIVHGLILLEWIFTK